MKAGWRAAWQISFGILIGLLTAAILLLVASPPRGRAITLSPPPSPQPLIVHISGAVLQPGVYTLPPGSRIQDGINAAGGLTLEADPSLLNLAVTLQDGERVHIPSKSLTPPPSPTTRSFTLPEPNPSSSLVNINTASLSELESLPGIGPTLAQRIIDYRQSNGPFTAVEEIQDVSGIGPAKFAQIADLISVSDLP
ncbi:MAG TPA: helix-hairpin-helix domain-containing protein [Anaerolineales bacterium]|nr:helix-hairpin-helix domain-containing protein [Anaerolineales bacterium]